MLELEVDLGIDCQIVDQMEKMKQKKQNLETCEKHYHMDCNRLDDGDDVDVVVAVLDMHCLASTCQQMVNFAMDYF